MLQLAAPPLTPHALPAEAVAEALGVDPARGLTADEVARRLAQFGPNALELQPPPSFLALLARQFRSLLIGILLVAAVLSLVVGDPQDAAVILAIVVLNALIGAVQEARAEQALAALRATSAPVARVRRNGIEQQIAAREVVPGDIVLVRAGDVVPADGRLLDSVSLQTDESALTGESVPVDKAADVVLPAETALADRSNLVFQGTAVTLGRGALIVTATGSATAMGALARTVAETGPQATPLERQIVWLGKVLSLLALGACAAVFGAGLLRGQPLGEMFLVAVSLAVAAVPEGLPAVVTIVLAVGVQRMARRNAIVRRLSAVEALGAATVICTDKTGTLTLGQMRVTTVLQDSQRTDLTQGTALRPDDVALRALLRAAVLCNNAQLEPQPAGDPTEQALLMFAATHQVDRAALEQEWPRTAEIPFSSERKRMTTIHRRGDTVLAITKGAPDYILARCSTILTSDGPRPLTADQLEDVHANVDALARVGLRTLALAERQLAAVPQQPLQESEAIERDLTLLGIVGLMDPPRPEVPAALQAARNAGIRVLMITGDHPATAAAIAAQLGITGQVLTGAALERMDETELARAVASSGVFARVSPQQKVIVVRVLRQQGAVVAMTGDGANDAPALRLADIGVAMGIRGTAVAKEAAAIVLTDDNFASIVAAVEEGRTIYANLRKVLLYLLAGNLGEVAVILMAMLVGLPLPLEAVQILWINLLTDALPALALGMEPREPNIMARPPRAPGESFLPRWTVPIIVVPSMMLALATLLAFVVSLLRIPDDISTARSTAFATLVLAHLGIAVALRSTDAASSVLPSRANPMMLAALAGGVASVLLLLYTGPGQTLFRTSPLDPLAWLLTLALMPLPFLAVEVVKALRRNEDGG